jgi:putative membrane protein
MHASFVVAGTLVWVQIVDPARHHRLTASERLGYAVLVFWTGQVMAYALLFDPSPLYSTYVDQPRRVLGLSPLTDQKIAGLVMMLEQVLTVGVAVILLLLAVRRERETEEAPPALGRRSTA